MTAEDWEAITDAYKAVVREQKGFEFPQIPTNSLNWL